MGHISTTPTLRHVQKHYTGAHDMELPPPQHPFKLYVYKFILNNNVLFHFLFLYFSCSCPYLYLAFSMQSYGNNSLHMSALYSLIIPRYTLRGYNKILWIYGHEHDR